MTIPRSRSANACLRGARRACLLAALPLVGCAAPDPMPDIPQVNDLTIELIRERCGPPSPGPQTEEIVYRVRQDTLPPPGAAYEDFEASELLCSPDRTCFSFNQAVNTANLDSTFCERQTIVEAPAGRVIDTGPVQPRSGPYGGSLYARITGDVIIRGGGSTLLRRIGDSPRRFFTVGNGGRLRLRDMTLEGGRMATGARGGVSDGWLEPNLASEPIGLGLGDFESIKDDYAPLSFVTYRFDSPIGERVPPRILRGGAVYVAQRGSFWADGVTFRRNIAQSGGAIASEGVLRVTGSRFELNGAKSGGAILSGEGRDRDFVALTPSRVEVLNSSFHRNLGSVGPAAISISNPTGVDIAPNPGLPPPYNDGVTPIPFRPITTVIKQSVFTENVGGRLILLRATTGELSYLTVLDNHTAAWDRPDATYPGEITPSDNHPLITVEAPNAAYEPNEELRRFTMENLVLVGNSTFNGATLSALYWHPDSFTRGVTLARNEIREWTGASRPLVQPPLGIGPVPLSHFNVTNGAVLRDPERIARATSFNLIVENTGAPACAALGPWRSTYYSVADDNQCQTRPGDFEFPLEAFTEINLGRHIGAVEFIRAVGGVSLRGPRLLEATPARDVLERCPEFRYDLRGRLRGTDGGCDAGAIEGD